MEKIKLRKRIIISFISGSILFCFLHGFQRKQMFQKLLEHEVTVELVVVEVFVMDKEGNFVDNLTKDDFEIYEDGKRVEIQYFALVKPEKEIPRKKASEEIAETEIPSRRKEMRLVILFDSINTNRVYLTRHWPEIMNMFQALFDKVEEIMIMELNRSSGVRIIQPFTSDKSLLSNLVSGFLGDLWADAEKKLRESQIKEMEMEMRKPYEARVVSNPEDIIMAIKEEEKHFRRLRLEDSFSAFISAVNYIRKFEGIKSVLLVSDGFHLEIPSVIGTREASESYVKIFDPFELFGGKKYFEQHEAFDRFLKLINEEMLIFYAFSPKGIKPSFEASPDSVSWPTMDETSLFQEERRQWSKELYSIEKIAEETGGLYLKGEKKYENFVKELGRDLTHFYDISYAPPEKTKKASYHKIDVIVKRPGLVVRFKKGYSDLTAEEVEKRNIASAFMSPSFFKDIAFSCNTDYISLREGPPRFWIRIQVSLDQFRDNRDMLSPDKLAMIFGIHEGSEEKIHYGEFEIPVKDAIERGSESLYYVFMTSEIELRPGEYETRVIMKQSEDRLGGWKTSLGIPDLKKEISVKIINSIFGFLHKSDTENSAPFSLSEADGSLLLSRYRLYPAAENVFRTGRKIALFLQTYIPRGRMNFPLEFYLQNDENITVNLSSEKVESFYDSKSKVLNEVYLLNFQEVPPGEYQVKLESSDRKIKRQIGIKVIPATQ